MFINRLAHSNYKKTDSILLSPPSGIWAYRSLMWMNALKANENCVLAIALNIWKTHQHDTFHIILFIRLILIDAVHGSHVA